MTPDEQIVVADHTVKVKYLLDELGYEIWKTPLQIPCPVHKLGQESRPSARIYQDDDHTVWCFYCVRQYWPTEIWEAHKGVDRREAANALLSRWPVDPSRAQAVLRAVTVPVIVPIEAIHAALLERHLTAHRGRAGYVVYRRWARGIDDFSLYLAGLKQEIREAGVQSFVERMNRELSNSYDEDSDGG